MTFSDESPHPILQVSMQNRQPHSTPGARSESPVPLEGTTIGHVAVAVPSMEDGINFTERSWD